MIDTSMREYNVSVTVERAGAAPVKIAPKHNPDPATSWMLDDAIAYVKDESRTASPGTKFTIGLDVREGADIG